MSKKYKTANLNSPNSYKRKGEKMAVERKNEAKKDIILYNFLKDNRKYKNSWDIKKTNNNIIQSILDKASKRKTDKRGEPDLLYIDESHKLLILLENKDSIKQHQSKEGNNVEGYAVDGVKHYLSFFTENYIETLPSPNKKYLKNWKIVGIAVSGNILDLYNHLISTFIINKSEIKDIETKEILNEEDYLSLFENVDMEKLIREVSESSKRINNKLRSLDSQKRPVLLSGLMICLFTRDGRNDFKEGYMGWEVKTVINNIPTTINQILKKEGIPKDKIEVLTNELSFIKTDQDLNNTEILKEILEELDKNVIPLFTKETNYDILGKFYEEFLRYAGISNVKNGIILTPSHITKLFTELVDIKNNDVILDTCCGTGTFLISSMNKLFFEINKSNIRNKVDLIKNIKEKQLIGFEKSSTMYALAISNMLFRGDGKSKVFNVDSFSDEAKNILNNLKKEGIVPTIGFINPPYGGQDNKDKPTKKEIQFLENMLDSVSRFGVIIAPLSTYIKEESVRERILSKHTLKCVINMPKELFQPNASAHTAVAVFETNKPHNNKEVVFYDLKEDGLILSKNRGRTDALNKWGGIKKKLFEELNNPDKFSDGFHLLKTTITGEDEWIIQAHSQTDYHNLNDESFTKSIKEYTIFSTKVKLGLLDKDIDELTLLEILNENNISAEEVLNESDSSN
ncbi:MAG TPA: N-6 DNA methylase [Candidatus Nanoarchaeia archaeon]|nr:N-6 DNA methylase [Candidatus Nanoarchaeia archaeon]